MDSGFFMQNEPNSGSSRPRQPIPPSNIQSRVPGNQRPTTEFTDTHRKENSDQPCLSVSFRVFRGYLLVTIFLVEVICQCTCGELPTAAEDVAPLGVVALLNEHQVVIEA